MSERQREPGWSALAGEGARLLARARRRPLIVLAAAALATAGAVAFAARRPLRARATVVLRLTDAPGGALARLGAGDRALRGYVTEVAFSQRRLRELVRAHGLSAAGADETAIEAAVATLRERVRVEVVQNHTLGLIPPAERPRSVHVLIAYEHADPGRALAVAQGLGSLVSAAGRGHGEVDARLVHRRALLEALQARRTVARLRAELARAEPGSRGAGGRRALRAAESRREGAEQALVAAELRLRVAAERGPSDIELLEPAPPRPAPVRARVLGATAAVAGLVAVPLAALVVGAFDRRIYRAEDLQVLGLRCLGHVPRRAFA